MTWAQGLGETVLVNVLLIHLRNAFAAAGVRRAYHGFYTPELLRAAEYAYHHTVAFLGHANGVLPDEFSSVSSLVVFPLFSFTFP